MSGIIRKIERQMGIHKGGKLHKENDELYVNNEGRSYIPNHVWLHPTKGWRRRSKRGLMIARMDANDRMGVIFALLNNIRTAHPLRG